MDAISGYNFLSWGLATSYQKTSLTKGLAIDDSSLTNTVFNDALTTMLISDVDSGKKA